jgi:hypothetical protein
MCQLAASLASTLRADTVHARGAPMIPISALLRL